MTRRSLDRQVIRTARELFASGLVVGTTGNVSARHDDVGRITPTRTPYRRMARSSLVALDLRNDRAEPRASREWRLHTAIYRARPDVGAIVHAHAAWSTAWSCFGEPLRDLEEASYYGIGVVRTAPYAPGGSPELAAAASGALGSSGAVLLARHGLVAVGDTPMHALEIARAVEHQAHVSWLVRVGTGAEARRPGAASRALGYGLALR